MIDTGFTLLASLGGGALPARGAGRVEVVILTTGLTAGIVATGVMHERSGVRPHTARA